MTSTYDEEARLFGPTTELPACFVDPTRGDPNICHWCKKPVDSRQSVNGVSHCRCHADFLFFQNQKATRLANDPLTRCAACSLELPLSSLREGVCKRCHRKSYNA